MKILLIDGQGGGVGRQLAIQIKQAFPDVQLAAVGTNTIIQNKKGETLCLSNAQNAVCNYQIRLLFVLTADICKQLKHPSGYPLNALKKPISVFLMVLVK